ncbi:MAG: hypothetical protein WBN94_10790 [Methanothrix sp.]
MMVDSTTPAPAWGHSYSSSTPRASSRKSWLPGKGLPKDEADNFIVSQERSDVVHDSPGLPGREDAGDEPGRSKRRSKASWAGWRATWGS